MRHIAYGHLEDRDDQGVTQLTIDEMAENFAKQTGWNGNTTLLLVAAIRENTEAMNKLADALNLQK